MPLAHWTGWKKLTTLSRKLPNMQEANSAAQITATYGMLDLREGREELGRAKYQSAIAAFEARGGSRGNAL